MSGHRAFSELRGTIPAGRRRENAGATGRLLEELALHELRQARDLSQEELAAVLHVGQPAVAKLERRADMYVSNLRRYIEALGGTLEITARFPDAEVKITNFGDIASSKPDVPTPS